MEHYYKFAIIRYSPDDTRGERLNIGAIVLSNEGLDIRISKRLDKVRALSAALDIEMLRNLIENIKTLDEKFLSTGASLEDRVKFMSRIGPLSISNLGTFSAEDATAYENRLTFIFKSMIDPEPQLPRFREKTSRLLTQVKTFFRQERVLAKKDETLDSHRIVQGYKLDEGLTADLALKNGVMHIIETIDASGDEHSIRKAIGEIGTAALVLESARMKFGKDKIKARLVYNASHALERIAMPSIKAAAHQDAEIVNWASSDDRNKFIHDLSSLATPIERTNRKSVVKFEKPDNHAFKFQ
jgi:hypothetical protein